MSYHLITNNQPRPLLCLLDMPEDERAFFDYVEPDDYSARFVQYRGTWHDTRDTQRIEPDSGRAHPMGWVMRVHPGEPLASFDSVSTDSHFSGHAYRFVDDGESVVVARFY